MDPQRFRSDLELVPTALNDLAGVLESGEARWPLDGRVPRRVLLTGMGSSWFAATVTAQRLRAAGIDAVAELASAELTWPAAPDLLVVAISASGGSVETIAAAERHAGVSQVVALTNTPGSPITATAGTTLDMHAGPETSGVACRSFRHTIALLLALEAQITGAVDVPDVLRRAAAASSSLLDREGEWLPPVLDALDSPDGTWFIAPAERWSSALQGALMVREVARRRGDGCETGDWSHVDAYLTTSLDYRAVLFTGSRRDPAAAEWMAKRPSTVVAVGGSFPGARAEVRHPDDHDPLVALLTEPLVAELVADAWVH